MEEKIDNFFKFRQRLIGDINPRKTALIVVDMQKYQVQQDFTISKIMNKITPGILEFFVQEVGNKVIPYLRNLIDFCHNVGISVIYTKYCSFMPDGSDLPKPVKFLNELAKTLLGEVAFPHISHYSSEIIDKLKPDDRDFVLQKNTSGTFISTKLDFFLRNMGIETVLVAGVVTNFCVYSTAREAADYGFQVIIVKDCCAAWAPEIHEAALKSFGLSYGFILSYEKVIKKVSLIMKKVKKEIATY